MVATEIAVKVMPGLESKGGGEAVGDVVLFFVAVSDVFLMSG